ncbi:hypothetical protein [Pseudoblastomonas halimionae]|uniref:Uncharacterized protein n=1 Tax=Alteriqipengyuania halimionae TaxID=1926630 RepID=A0A6I4TYN8_9SPHN|nr:hypothetical protein [Alteriqipengyuania halimionae]MXP08666.1 hypothetical protein [Alteriqipengyuania halimionae]
MAELIQTHWLALVLAVLLGLFVAWWLFGRKKPERERHVSPDVLDEGAAPANRNQALIDAPPAAAMDSLAGAGVAVSAAGGEDKVETDNAEDKVEASAAAAATTPQTADAPPVAPEPVPAAATATPADPDALKTIKGVGPKLRTRLAELGVTSIAQVAAWTEEDVDRIDAQLEPRFQGRIRRDNWVEQAKLLETGDRAAYEAKFGKL